MTVTDDQMVATARRQMQEFTRVKPAEPPGDQGADLEPEVRAALEQMRAGNR